MPPRQEAWDTALAHAPSDGRRIRRFESEAGHEVTVFHSDSLAERFDEELFYFCSPVGTYSIELQRLPGDRVYFGARVFTGVEFDANDPEPDDDC